MKQFDAHAGPEIQKMDTRYAQPDPGTIETAEADREKA
jgi:hypothetical protein